MNDFVLPANKRAIRNHMRHVGITPKAGFEELARRGSLRLSAEVRVVYCRHRYNLVDDASTQGESVAAFASPELRQEIPAAQVNEAGTYEQRQAAAAKDLSATVDQELFRQRFLSM